MGKIIEEEDEEKDFDDWIESIAVVDKDNVPIRPELVVDEDQGEDGDSE